MNRDYIVYILTHSGNRCTYVGMTNHPERRILQHNGLKSGGAKYTRMKKESGEWSYYAHISPCSKSEALSIEKLIHIHSKKEKGTPLEKRIQCAEKILAREKFNDMKMTIIKNDGDNTLL